MGYEQILYDVSGGVARITLNRPDKLNAWTQKMEDEAASAMRRAANDEAARVILLSGAGRSFCAGADMSLLTDAVESGGSRSRATADFDFDQSADRDLRKKYSWLLSVPKPVIAAIQGHCVGLGFVIALYCDVRFAADSARFCTIFGKRGLVAEYGMGWMLPRIVGAGNAMDLLLSARTVSGTEAHAMGLVQRVFPEAELLEAAANAATDMAQSISPRSLRIMKRQVWDGLRGSLGDSIDFAYREMVASFGTEDFREGVAHYLEKRPARFTGR